MLIFPVFIPQKGCPFDCIYCNQTQIGSVKEISTDILKEQIHQFCEFHKEQTKQIAFFGGTFTGLPESERDIYYELVEPYLDDNTSIRISTRPDFVDNDALNWCKVHQVKTIELGIQDFSDSVLKAINRGYSGKDAVESCLRVKEAGFELGVQLMPGLPCSSPASHRESSESLLGVMPDFIRLYPLIVLSGTQVWQDWEAGKFQPLTLEEAIDICVYYHEVAEEHGIEVIKTGIPPLETDTKYAGPYHPAFGELVLAELLIRKVKQLYLTDKTIHISPHDLSLLTGHQKYNLKKLLNGLDLCSIKIRIDSEIKKGNVMVSDSEPNMTLTGLLQTRASVAAKKHEER